MLLYCAVIEILTHHALWKETTECFSLEITLSSGNVGCGTAEGLEVNCLQ